MSLFKRIFRHKKKKEIILKPVPKFDKGPTTATVSEQGIKIVFDRPPEPKHEPKHPSIRETYINKILIYQCKDKAVNAKVRGYKTTRVKLDENSLGGDMRGSDISEPILELCKTLVSRVTYKKVGNDHFVVLHIKYY